MKKVILLALVMPYAAFGQVIDNFESASLSNWVESTESHWKADTAGAISGIYSLHHVFDNSLSGSDCIGLAENDLHPDEGTSRWSFSVRHGCDPSASNNWTVYVMSDAEPLTFGTGTTLSGFAVGVNLTGYDDSLRLWKIKKGNATVVATALLNWQTDIGNINAARIVVERSYSGGWTIEAFDINGILKARASGFDAETFYPACFLVNYRYTSSRDRLLWIDDVKIEGVFHEDKEPPMVTGCNITGINSLELILSESPSADFQVTSNFHLESGSNNPSSIEKISPVLYRLKFPGSFINKKQQKLEIVSLCDLAGNCTNNVPFYFTPVWADPGDVIITEIMADPIPAVSLPEKEYIEIFNRSAFSIKIKKWTLNITGQAAQFPETDIVAGEYAIVCSTADTSAFSVSGRVIGLKSFPSLTDAGRVIWIADSSGNLIHGVEYSAGWYGNKLKSAGGWSLEMIDTDNPFYESGNWEASSGKSGGTPGKVNSVSRQNSDPEFSGIENIFPVNERNIKLRLSETTLGADGRLRISINGTEANAVTPSDPLLKSFIIDSPYPLSTGKVYTLSIDPAVGDFAGNPIKIFSGRFGLPETATPGSIRFNEVLFDPYPEEPEYIELFNTSDKTTDASVLYFASINCDTGDTSSIVQVSNEARCILPRTLFTVTTDRLKVTQRYPRSDGEFIFNTSSLPSMPDDKGHLLLLTRNLEKVDEMEYSCKMHSPLLSGTEGISLEKIRPEMDSNESTSWYSASESAEWGTPGKSNSVFADSPVTDERIKLSASAISPDNDGNDDVLVIDINTSGLGNVISVTLFDENGSLVRRLKENFFADNKASVVWDASYADGSLVSPGIYIILIELYNDKGESRSWKKICTVMR